MTHPRLFAASCPDKPAIVMADSGETLSYRALELSANRYAQAFRRQGLKSGDCVAVWLENGPDLLQIYWAVQRAGLYLLPIPVHLQAEEAAYLLKDSDAALLFVSPKVRQAAKLVGTLCSKLPELRKIVAVRGPVSDAQTVQNWLEGCPSVPIVDETAGRHFVYSSGTTGRPKGIRMALTGNSPTEPDSISERLAEQYGLDGTSLFLCPAPLYHTAPLVFSTTIHRMGGTVVVMPGFEAEATLAAIERFRISATFMVPTMFQRLLRLPEDVRLRHDLSSLRCVIHAAAPCPVATKHQMIAWFGPILWEFYSGSEGAGSTVIDSHEWLERPGSVGRAKLGKLHILDSQGSELPPGQTGRVFFESPVRFEYFKDPRKTSESRHPDHGDWVTLGDIGHIDNEGYLYLTDRENYMIISGGVNVYPQEIENLLATYPGVVDVAVIGVPDTDMGEVVKAVVQPEHWNRAGPEFAAELMAHCREHLSPIKCPRSVDFNSRLPREDSGKLFKRMIRDHYWNTSTSGGR